MEVFVLFGISQELDPFLLEIDLFSLLPVFMIDLIKSNKFVAARECHLLLAYPLFLYVPLCYLIYNYVSLSL